MHRADQTPWLTLRFTMSGWLDPCNGPLVPIGGACHPHVPDSKLFSQSAAPHLLLPPGLSLFPYLTSWAPLVRNPPPEFISSQSVSYPSHSFFGPPETAAAFVLTDTDQLLLAHTHYPPHLLHIRTYIHTHTHTHFRLAIYDRITISRC